jgi:hypothetical protein
VAIIINNINSHYNYAHQPEESVSSSKYINRLRGKQFAKKKKNIGVDESLSADSLPDDLQINTAGALIPPLAYYFRQQAVAHGSYHSFFKPSAKLGHIQFQTKSSTKDHIATVDMLGSDLYQMVAAIACLLPTLISGVAVRQTQSVSITYVCSAVISFSFKSKKKKKQCRCISFFLVRCPRSEFQISDV